MLGFKHKLVFFTDNCHLFGVPVFGYLLVIVGVVVSFVLNETGKQHFKITNKSQREIHILNASTK